MFGQDPKWFVNLVMPYMLPVVVLFAAVGALTLKSLKAAALPPHSKNYSSRTFSRTFTSSAFISPLSVSWS